MKKILITGGAGFIGSNLCKRLLENSNNKIFCLDNLYSSNIDNIKEFKNNPNFEFVEHDIINPIDIEVDEIYNLACPASPVFYQKDSIHTIKTNIFGIFNLLELVKRYNSKLLQASTSEVYGDPIVHPQTEEYWGNVNPIGERACYDESKRLAETILTQCAKKYSMDIKIARIFNTYGPKMQINDGRVISNFVVQALKNEDITVYGKGTQTRSFCYIDDIIDVIIKLMAYKNSSYMPINVGNDDEYKIIDLAKLIIQKTNSKSKIIFNNLPSDDPKVRRPDLTRAHNILGWRAGINLDEGLNKTIEYFKGIIK
jgi:UDP-glucuronate decarboxylase